MTEQVMPHPGVCEHVTKMGRLGSKGPMSTEALAPQFRKLPNGIHRERFDEPADIKPPEPIVPEVVPVFKDSDNEETGELQNSSIPESKPIVTIVHHINPIKQNIPAEPARVQHHDTRPPYVEMKLGRNMRAAPKGSLAARQSQSSINSQQLDREPLLRSQPHPSNNIVEYYTNTHCAQPLQSQASSITSRQYPTRSITSPQHPSQDLIEMLNRNNQTVLSHDSQVIDHRDTSAAERQERFEAELRRTKEMENLNLNERNEPQVSVEPEIVSQFVATPRSPTEETFVKEPYEVIQIPNMAPPPPITSLYGSYRVQENYMTQGKPSDEGSTQPFTPHVTDSYSPRHATTESSATGLTGSDQREERNKPVAAEEEESVDEDIVEDIDEAAESENENEVKDEDFDF